MCLWKKRREMGFFFTASLSFLFLLHTFPHSPWIQASFFLSPCNKWKRRRKDHARLIVLRAPRFFFFFFSCSRFFQIRVHTTRGGLRFSSSHAIPVNYGNVTFSSLLQTHTRTQTVCTGRGGILFWTKPSLLSSLLPFLSPCEIHECVQISACVCVCVCARSYNLTGTHTPTEMGTTDFFPSIARSRGKILHACVVYQRASELARLRIRFYVFLPTQAKQCVHISPLVPPSSTAVLRPTIGQT